MTWRDILPMNMFGNYLPKGAFNGADRQAAGAAQSDPDNRAGAAGGGAVVPVSVCYTAAKAADAAGVTARTSSGDPVIDRLDRNIAALLDVRDAALVNDDRAVAAHASDVLKQYVAERHRLVALSRVQAATSPPQLTARAPDVQQIHRANQQHLVMLNHRAMLAGQRPSSPYPYSPFHDDLPPPALKDGGLTVGEIVGWRCWLWKRGYLRSVYRDDLWMPGEPLEAPVSPTDHGEEGIHAWKDRRGAVNYAMEWVDKGAAIIGQVKLYGAVVEHDLGYRAQYAAIASVVDAVGAPMPVLATLEDVRARYNVGASWPPPKESK